MKFSDLSLKKMEDEDFQIVGRKRGRSRTSKKTKVKIKFDELTATSEWTENDTRETIRRIWECHKEIEQSEFLQSFMSSLNQSLASLDESACVNSESDNFESRQREDGTQTVDNVVCYGLGNFSKCIISRYQLALLLCLKFELKLVTVYVFDPVFLPCEKEILTSLGIFVIDRNEEGKRKVKSRTLFYLPHCGKALYNNLLWANWGPCISQIVIIGNSFTRVSETFTNRTLQTRWPYLLRAITHSCEVCVDNNFRFRDVFNDLAIHVFPYDRVNNVPHEYWEDCTEPVYDTKEVEIITNDMMQHFNFVI